ncbi:MAG TPA: hypothetical protein VKE74_31115 [Gemmataceae bacterium]|nr:hypothetical protein [Gemmataceae bacterium]
MEIVPIVRFDDLRPTPPPETRALAGVPPEVVEKIAAARDRVPPTLRGLLLAALADPVDRAGLKALYDWIGEFADVPETVWVPARSGPAAVGFDQQLGWAWWHRASGLHPDLIRALLPGEKGETSLRRVCETDPAQLYQCPGVGPRRLAQLRAWLAAAGLRLKGDPPLTVARPELGL